MSEEMKAKWMFCIVMFLSLLLSGRVFSQNIDTTGCYLHESEPVEGCEMSVVTVDSVSQLIQLSWHPSPDEQVVGYCICSGSPCLGLDTIWGHFDTTYTCLSHSCFDVHRYCVFAIDSCFHGSALTDPVSNIVLRIDADSCNRHVHLSWNPYINSREGVERYEISWKADGVYSKMVCAPTVYEADTVLGDGVMELEVRVSAVTPLVTSWSNLATFLFAPPEGCEKPPIPVPPVDPDKDTVDIFFPNVFTPSLSENNQFCPCYRNEVTPFGYEINIYNRMGLRVFHSTDPSACWNGTYQQAPLPQGVYVYMATYHSAHEVVYQKGTVLLLR